jgi:tetratricopeptide (TPR) repeat protein
VRAAWDRGDVSEFAAQRALWSRVRVTVSVLAIGAIGLLLSACGGNSKVTTSSPTATSTTTAGYSTLVGAGLQLLRGGNLDAAEQLFRQAIAKNSSNPVGYYDLGVTYQQEGRRKRALRQYRLAMTHDPRYVPALYNAAVLLTGHRNAVAMFFYRQVISIRPDSPTALLNLGLLEAPLAGVAREAYHHLTSAIRLDPALRTQVPAALLTNLQHQASREPALRRQSSRH